MRILPAHDRYLLVHVGWDNSQHVHGCLAHIDILTEPVVASAHWEVRLLCALLGEP